MIIIDFSGIAIATIAVNKVNDENMLRHMMLNSIRMYRTKFKKDYGEVVLAIDSGNNWRRNYFPQYKANRRKGRDDVSPALQKAGNEHLKGHRQKHHLDPESAQLELVEQRSVVHDSVMTR